MIRTPKYTFLLPSYKARFFEEALLSIKNQTYTDFKVIVSDDCSPEDLKSIYDRVCASDTRFTYRRNEKNMGSQNLVSHWNLLVDMCDTEYLIMAGDDDVYDVCFLEKMDKLSVKYPKVDLYRSRVVQISSDGERINTDALYPELVDHIRFISQLYYNNACLCIGNYVFRTNGLKKNGSFVDFPLAWYSDIATTIKISKHGVAICSETLFYFRMSGLNLSSLNRNISPNEARKKIDATLQYKQWFDECLAGLFSTNVESLYIKEQLILWSGQNISGMISCYLPYLTIKDFLSMLKRIKHLRLGACYFLLYYLRTFNMLRFGINRNKL